MNDDRVLCVSIGNSDNKLSQRRWAQFCRHIASCCRSHASAMYGEWYSLPNDRVQNASFMFAPDGEADLIWLLQQACAEYEQDSIALTVGTTTLLAAGPAAVAQRGTDA